MAETGTNLDIQQSTNIPGLGSARRAQNEDVQNQEIEADRAERNRQEEVRREEDRVSVRETNPGDIERNEIRLEGETFDVPSQNIQENLGQTTQPDSGAGGTSVADLNQGIREDAGLTAGPQSGPGNVGGGGVSALQENVGGLEQEPAFRQTLDDGGNEPDPIQPEPAGARGTREVLENPEPREETAVNAEPANNPVQGAGDLADLTEADAGQAATSTGTPNAINQALRQNQAEESDQEQARQEQENEQREPEREQTERGQNVDRLV